MTRQEGEVIPFLAPLFRCVQKTCQREKRMEVVAIRAKKLESRNPHLGKSPSGENGKKKKKKRRIGRVRTVLGRI